MRNDRKFDMYGRSIKNFEVEEVAQSYGRS